MVHERQANTPGRRLTRLEYDQLGGQPSWSEVRGRVSTKYRNSDSKVPDVEASAFDAYYQDHRTQSRFHRARVQSTLLHITIELILPSGGLSCMYSILMCCIVGEKKDISERVDKGLDSYPLEPPDTRVFAFDLKRMARDCDKDSEETRKQQCQVEASPLAVELIHRHRVCAFVGVSSVV